MRYHNSVKELVNCISLLDLITCEIEKGFSSQRTDDKKELKKS